MRLARAIRPAARRRGHGHQQMRAASGACWLWLREWCYKCDVANDKLALACSV